MRPVIEIVVLICIVALTIHFFRDYEVKTTEREIATLIETNADFRKLSVRLSKPGMLAVDGAFASPESAQRFMLQVRQVKKKRFCCAPTVEILSNLNNQQAPKSPEVPATNVSAIAHP